MGTITTRKKIGAHAGGLVSALTVVGVLSFGGAAAANAGGSPCPGPDHTRCYGNSDSSSSSSSSVTTPSPNLDDASRKVNDSWGGIRQGARGAGAPPGAGGGMSGVEVR